MRLRPGATGYARRAAVETAVSSDDAVERIFDEFSGVGRRGGPMRDRPLLAGVGPTASGDPMCPTAKPEPASAGGTVPRPTGRGYLSGGELECPGLPGLNAVVLPRPRHRRVVDRELGGQQPARPVRHPEPLRRRRQRRRHDPSWSIVRGRPDRGASQDLPVRAVRTGPAR